MQAREFNTFAKGLAKDRSAASTRTAVSRAYYAAFHVCLEFIESLSFRIPKFGGHVLVREHLNNSGEKQLEVAASLLADLYDSRIKADYELRDSSAEDWKDVGLKTTLADSVISAVDLCSKSGKRTQIQTRLSGYRKMRGL